MTARLSSKALEAGKDMAKRKLLGGAFESTVTKFANSGHVVCPKDWIGKRVKVEVLPDENTVKEVEKE